MNETKLDIFLDDLHLNMATSDACVVVPSRHLRDFFLVVAPSGANPSGFPSYLVQPIHIQVAAID